MAPQSWRRRWKRAALALIAARVMRMESLPPDACPKIDDHSWPPLSWSALLIIARVLCFEREARSASPTAEDGGLPRSILPHTGSQCPDGWLCCPGTALTPGCRSAVMNGTAAHRRPCKLNQWQGGWNGGWLGYPTAVPASGIQQLGSDTPTQSYWTRHSHR